MPDETRRLLSVALTAMRFCGSDVGSRIRNLDALIVALGHKAITFWSP